MYIKILFVIFSDYEFKILLLGDAGVGKSCLILRFAVSLKIVCIVAFHFISINHTYQNKNHYDPKVDSFILE